MKIQGIDISIILDQLKGCSNGNCDVLGYGRSGMHTNGGCHCLDWLSAHYRHEARQYFNQSSSILRKEPVIETSMWKCLACFCEIRVESRSDFKCPICGDSPWVPLQAESLIVRRLPRDETNRVKNMDMIHKLDELIEAHNTLVKLIEQQSIRTA